MFVSDRMSRRLFTIEPDQTVEEAAEIMARHRVHQLPVVREGDRLVGLITDRDVRSARAGGDQAARIERFMTAGPITVGPGEPLEDALLLLYGHRFGSLPVVTPAPAGDRDGQPLPRVVGIITRTDILGALIEMLGLAEPGTRLEVQVPEGANRRLHDAMQALDRCGARLISLIYSSRPGRPGGRLHVRLSTIDPRAAIDALADAGFPLADPFCELM